MPARIVVVHDDSKFVDELAQVLRAEGLDVATFPDPIAAWDSLEAVQKTEVLVTRVAFPEGRSNGMALVRMAASKRREIKVIFLARPEYAEEVREEGMFMPLDVLPEEVAEEVKRLLIVDDDGNVAA
jgi:DNA-binding NtrC family response regulator